MIYFIGDKSKIITSNNNIEVIPIDRAINEISTEKLICEDTETLGLDFTSKDVLRLVQIGTKNNQYLFDVKTCEIKKLKSILENKEIQKIVANVYFERNMLRSIGIVINNTFDLLIANKVLRQGRNTINIKNAYGTHSINSLAGLYYNYLNIDLDKGEQKSFMESNNYSNKQLEYAARDVMLFDIYDEIVRRLIKYELIHEDYSLTENVSSLASKNKFSVTVLEQKVALYFADMMYNGIYIDFKQLMSIYDSNIERKYEIEKKLNTYVIDKYPSYSGYIKNPMSVHKVVQKSLFGDDIRITNNNTSNRRINWNSNVQVKPIIFEEIGRVIKDKYGKETIGIDSIDKPEYTSNQFIKDYVEYAKIKKLISSYGLEYKKYINENTGRIHCSIDQILKTGRVAPKNPNLAQIPSDKEWRMLFRGSDRTKIVGGDYSAQESRIMADKSKDPIFIDFFVNGDGDSHSMIASKVYSAKEKRSIIVNKYSVYCEVISDEDEAIKWVKINYSSKCKIKTEIINDIKYVIAYDDNPIEENRISNPLRQKGKVLNFFISFGGSAYTIHESQGISIEEATELLNGFWKAFSELERYFSIEKVKALKSGYIIINDVTKRKRFLPDWKEWRIIVNKLEEIKKNYINQYGYKDGSTKFFNKIKDKSSEIYSINKMGLKLKGDMEREAMNTGIQGTAADITKTAEILLMEKLEDMNYDLVSNIKPINHIHDEIMLEVNNEDTKLASDLLETSMNEAASIFCNILKIPAKPYISEYWVH